MEVIIIILAILFAAYSFAQSRAEDDDTDLT